MLRVEPLELVLELPPPQPASTVAVIKKNAAPAAYAYRLRLAASIIESINAIIASAIASHARKTNGVVGGRTLIMPGGNADRAVVSVAVQDADVVLVAPVDLHVAAAVPRFVLPFRNCTVPLGPTAELLFVLTTAVSVTVPPDAMLVTLEVTAVVVVACVIVTESALLLACEV